MGKAAVALASDLAERATALPPFQLAAFMAYLCGLASDTPPPLGDTPERRGADPAVMVSIARISRER